MLLLVDVFVFHILYIENGQARPKQINMIVSKIFTSIFPFFINDEKISRSVEICWMVLLASVIHGQVLLVYLFKDTRNRAIFYLFTSVLLLPKQLFYTR